MVRAQDPGRVEDQRVGGPEGEGRREEGPEGGGLEGRGQPEKVGAGGRPGGWEQGGWKPKIALFPPLPSQISFYLLFLGVFFVELFPRFKAAIFCQPWKFWAERKPVQRRGVRR